MSLQYGMKTLAIASVIMAAGLTASGVALPAAAYADNHMQKMTVEADNELEWRRDDQQYIARGNAVITTKDMVFNASIITAHYDNSANTGNNRITLIIGDGKAEVVRLNEQGNEDISGMADRITYDRASDIMTLSRQKNSSDNGMIRVTRGYDISEADVSIVYDRNKGIITSTGNSITTLADGRRMHGDQAVTTLKDDGSTIDTIIVTGQVMIIQPMAEGGTQQATGQKAVYDAALDIVTVTGDVVLTQQENVIKGGTAVMRIGEGQSVVTSDENTGRVSGQFFIEDNNN